MPNPDSSWYDSALGWMGENYAYPVTDFFYNAQTGTLSPHQLGQLQSDTEAAMLQAGASDAAATDAGAQVSNFVRNYWSGRSALGTLWDDVNGNPLGIQGGQGMDWSWAIVLLIAIVLLVLVVKVLLEQI